MSLQRICINEVVSVAPEVTVLELARLMAKEHVGSVIALQDHRPIGIVTDRDIVLKVVARGQEPNKLAVRDIMTPNPAVVNINYDPLDATRLMRDNGLRRLPVVDENRRLIGVITLDDLLLLLASEMANLAGAVEREVKREGTERAAS